tara:strand:+ start:167 stop:499 length:333 start_codon:yes stop_codon:yes gene_type:complete
MDTTTILEAYGTLGATGCCVVFLGYMLINLIKSQEHQDQELETIRENISKMNEVISNSQSIILKLVDKTQRVKESQEDSDSRRFESLMKEIDDLSDKIAYITGRLNGHSK